MRIIIDFDLIRFCGRDFYEHVEIFVCTKWSRIVWRYLLALCLPNGNTLRATRLTDAIKVHGGSNAAANEVRDFAESIRHGRENNTAAQ